MTTPKPMDRGEEIDLAEIGLSIRRHWRKIALLTALATAVAIMIALLTIPRFTIAGSLYLGDARAQAPTGQEGPLDYLSDFTSVSDINTQVELITAQALVQQAVLESGFNASVTASGGGTIPYWQWRLLHGGAVYAFAPRPGDLAAVDASFDNPPDGTESFDVTVGDHGDYSVVLRAGWFSDAKPVLRGVLGHPAAGGGLNLLLQPALDGVAPLPGAHFVMKITPAPLVEQRLRLNRLLTVVAGGTPSNPTKVADLQLLTRDPYRGQIFLNRLMTDFIASQVQWKTEAAAQSESFISSQLDQVKKSLADADRKLAAYKAATGIMDVPENTKTAIDQVSADQTQRAALALQQQALQQLQTEIDHPTGTVNPYLITQSNDPALGALAGTLADAQGKLQALQVQFTAGSPDVQVQQALVDRTEQSIRSVVANDLAQANANLRDMDAQLDQLNAQFRNMPAQSLQVVALTRASDVYGQIYVLLMQKQAEAEVSKAITTADTRMVTPAQLPLQATEPRIWVILGVGFCVGLFGGLAFTLAQQAISGRFQSEAEVRRAVSMPIYGAIPRRPGMDAGSVFPQNRQTPFAEAFRLLRSAIYRSAATQESKVVLVTSSSENDGKTTVSLNLAKALADDGKRVILIDADLHVGRVHEIVHVDPLSGLTEWLVDMRQPELMTARDERFTVLPAGVLPPNPSELLNEPYFAEIIATLRTQFDAIVIDSPPLPATADALALGAHADLILTVVMIDHTVKRVLQVHNEMMDNLDRRHGVVINGVAGARYAYGYSYKPVTRTQRAFQSIKKAIGG